MMLVGYGYGYTWPYSTHKRQKFIQSSLFIQMWCSPYALKENTASTGGFKSLTTHGAHKDL